MRQEMRRRAEALLHGFTDRYPDSIFDAEAPELEANVLLAMNNASRGAAGAGAGRGSGSGRTAPAFNLPQGQVEFALGQTGCGWTHVQATVAEPSIELRKRRWRGHG